MENSNYTIEPDIKETLDKVVKLLTDNLGNIFSKDKSSIIAKSGNVFEVLLKRKVTMEGMVPLLIHVLKTRVLFGIGDSTDRCQSSVLYSIPYFNNMYSIYMYSDSYGVISTMTITVYDSMEKEYGQLSTELRRVKSHKGIIYEEETVVDLASIFS